MIIARVGCRGDERRARRRGGERAGDLRILGLMKVRGNSGERSTWIGKMQDEQKLFTSCQHGKKWNIKTMSQVKWHVFRRL